MNVDKMVIIPIPDGYYNELIDGRSITIIVPQLSGATGISAKTLVSSTYTTLLANDKNALLGDNMAFLFSDDVNPPYTGTTNGGTSSNSANTTWNTTSYLNRPPAISYVDLLNTDIFTDKRPSSSIKFAYPVPVAYPTNTNQGYNYDIPVGYVSLNKGFFIITHPNIVNNIPWTQGYQQYSNLANNTVASATTDIYFTSPAVSNATFLALDINYQTSVICIGLPGEFFYSNNPTFPESNATEFTNGTNNYTPIQVTEIGLYNINNELIAVAKLSEPVEKTYTNILTFNLNIDV